MDENALVEALAVNWSGGKPDMERLRQAVAGALCDLSKIADSTTWLPCKKTLPPFNEYVEVIADGGVVSFPYNICIAYRYSLPLTDRGWEWRKVNGYPLSDSGFYPMYWRVCQPNPLSM